MISKVPKTARMSRTVYNLVMAYTIYCIRGSTDHRSTHLECPRRMHLHNPNKVLKYVDKWEVVVCVQLCALSYPERGHSRHTKPKPVYRAAYPCTGEAIMHKTWLKCTVERASGDG